MSSSNCTPSKKLPWVRSMDAKIAHENKLWESAVRVAEGGKANVPLPTDKGGKQKAENITKFAQFIEQAKIDKVKRQDKEAKKQQKKKEESEQ